MNRESVHEFGCSRRHTARQQCDGPVAEARRLAAVDPSHALRAPDAASADLPVWPPWLTSPLSGAAFELVPGLAVLIIWIGSRPESVKYSDFGPLVWLACLPSIGWFWRGAVGCAVVPAVWLARIVLVILAIGFWGHAYDYGQELSVYDQPWRYREVDYCCRSAWLVGMHIALGATVALAALSAYGVAFVGREDWARGADHEP